jgi:hypothetical protein
VFESALALICSSSKAICHDRGAAVHYPFGVTVAPHKPKSKIRAIQDLLSQRNVVADGQIRLFQDRNAVDPSEFLLLRRSPITSAIF